MFMEIPGKVFGEGMRGDRLHVWQACGHPQLVRVVFENLLRREAVAAEARDQFPVARPRREGRDVLVRDTAEEYP